MTRVPTPPRPACLAAALLLLLPTLPGEPAPTPPPREIAIDAIHRPAPDGLRPLSYHLRCLNPSLDIRSLRHREAARHVKTALSGHGLFEAPPKVRPDLIVEFDYGVEPSGIRYEKVTVPIYARPSDRAIFRPRSRPGRILASPADEVVVGYREITCPVTTREKYLSLSARLNQEHADQVSAPEFWRVRVRIDDDHDDLRTCLPLLATAAMETIGENTGGTTTLTLAGNEPTVRFIRAGL